MLKSSAVVSFTYDARRRLTGESRVETVDQVPTTVIDSEYTYDQLGNRLTKVDDVNDWLTTYEYDVNHPDPNDLECWTQNNRLLSYTVEDISDPNDPILLRTVRYTYYGDGNVSNITVQDGGTLIVKDLGFYYTHNRTPWIMLWSQWGVDANGDYDPTDPNDPNDPNDVAGRVFTMLNAREFRLNGPTRVVTRDFNPNTEYHDFVGDQHWTNGADDFTMDTSATRGLERCYAGNFGFSDWDDQTLGWYYHRDLIGSTTMLTNSDGDATDPFHYTAFGEVVATPDPGAIETRYQYAGGYGYEADMLVLTGADPNSPLPPITLMHVGHRFYQPDIGRFVQRDPIGIDGGLNVYLYCGGEPVTGVDPLGLWVEKDVIKHRDGSATVHYYNRGLLGLKNDHFQTIQLKPGYTFVPKGPRDERDMLFSCCLATDVGAGIGGVGGCITGGPIGGVVGFVGGGVTGFLGWAITEEYWLLTAEPGDYMLTW